MKAVLWLRVTSILALVHGILHTVGGVLGGAAPGPQLEALTAMKANHFPAFGVSRSYWDFYLGYGLFVTAFFLVQTVLFWQMASMAKTKAAFLRPLLVTLALGYVLMALVSARYFFAGPAVVELLMAGCLGAAYVGAAERQGLKQGHYAADEEAI